MSFESDMTDKPHHLSLRGIIGLWLVVAVPMAVLAMVVAPWLISRLSFQPTLIYWACMILGMMWQFVVSLGVLLVEGWDRTWPDLKGRLWLQAPRDPKTGRTNPWILPRWVIVGTVLVAGLSFLLGPWLDDPLAAALPAWLMPAYSDVASLAVPENTGAWYLLWFVLVSSLFNYALGEAFFFHCILLPRMPGVFGRWAWVANGVLFAGYHIHKIAAMPTILVSTLVYAFPAQRYKSAWPAILIHGVEGFVLLGAVLFVILGGIAR